MTASEARRTVSRLSDMVKNGYEVRIEIVFGRFEVSVFDSRGDCHSHWSGGSLEEAVERAAQGTLADG